MISLLNDNTIVETMINEQGKWGECFNGFDMGDKLPVSSEQIKNSIKKCYEKAVSVDLKRGNIAEVTCNGSTMSTMRIAYRTFRQTDRAKLPFYSMSVSKYTDLENEKIKKVLLLFWEKQENGSRAPFYYFEMKLEDVKNWDLNKENKLYRINAKRKDDGKYLLNDSEMRKAEKGVTMAGNCGGIE